MRRFAFALLVLSFAAPASAGTFMSLKSDKVFLREGPTFRHRVLYIYKRKDYPLEVLATYEGWRRVRDAEGTVGWVSQTMLSEKRTVLVVGKGRAALRAQPYAKAPLIAWMEPGVVARLKACKPRFCEVVADGLAGWAEKARIWGVRAGETFD
ncbi:MAG TPA: SH3 domain-containing protein [Rhizomicrobium sp.]|nr:SH3 domain-containing protein [Rhizomicrobium sp.]